jgi:putative hydrolase of the HAD superfamily
MGERYGLRWDADQTEEVVQRFFTAYESEWVPVAGVVPLLQALHPCVVLGVVTNGLWASQWAKLEAAGLAGYFRFMTAPDTAEGALKPHPIIYQKALTQAGASVDTTVFVGDLWETDIQGANNIGMRALWYNPTRQMSPNPEWARDIASYEPLAPILEWLNLAD